MLDILLQCRIKKSYFSGSGDKSYKLKKVEAFVAVEITQGPHLVEESVKDGLYGFRNIVCWQNGDLQLSGNPRVKRFWSGDISEDTPEENAEGSEGNQGKAQTEPGLSKRRLSEPSKLHYPCLDPQNCPFARVPGIQCKENRPQDSPGESSGLNKPDKKAGRSRGVKRPLEKVEPTSPQDRVKAQERVKAASRWTDRELLEWL